MSFDTFYTLATLLPATSADALLSSVLMCAVVLGAALLYSLSTNRHP